MSEQAEVVPYPVCGCGHRYDGHTDPGDPRQVGCWLCGCKAYAPAGEPAPTAEPPKPCPIYNALKGRCDTCGEKWKLGAFHQCPAKPEPPAPSPDESVEHLKYACRHCLADGCGCPCHKIPRLEPAPSPDLDPLDVFVARVLQSVAELPDRTSPDDWPEAMLVTHEELEAILREAARALRGESK